MSKMSGTCDAPCIINAGGFAVVSCTKSHGHKGDEHSTELPGLGDSPGATVTWKYIGHVGGSTDISDAIPLGKGRCDCRIRVTGGLHVVAPNLKVEHEVRTLFSNTLAERGEFCCGRTSGHPEEEHCREGIFDMLGMKWKITW